MTATDIPLGSVFAPTDVDRRIAADLDRILGEISADAANIQINIKKAESEEMIPIPLEHFRLLAHILAALSQGRGIALMPTGAELTTNEAARQLKVSRPFLIGLLEKGEIPYRMVGSHRRIRFSDLDAYRERMTQKRLETLEKLSALDQEYGLG